MVWYVVVSPWQSRKSEEAACLVLKVNSFKGQQSE